MITTITLCTNQAAISITHVYDLSIVYLVITRRNVSTMKRIGGDSVLIRKIHKCLKKQEHHNYKIDMK